jgi:hypothetical protein
MDDFIFITPEKLNCEPILDRPEPEFYNMLSINESFDDMFQNSLRDLIELTTGAGPARNFRLDYNNRNLKFFSPRSQRGKLPIAS